MPERFRGLAYFERQLSALSTALNDLSIPWEGVIHTQGSEDESQALLSENVGLSQAKSEFEDFHEMCCSDFLVASPSSFSMTAGMISGGLVMRPREWFHSMPTSDRWVGVDAAGGVDMSELRLAVERVVARSS
jgi:hypothetical protein